MNILGKLFQMWLMKMLIKQHNTLDFSESKKNKKAIDVDVIKTKQ